MNKAELIEYVAYELGMYKKDVRKIIEKTFDGVEYGLRKDGKVSIVGFGNFSVVRRESRKGRNPKTGETVHIGARNVPVWKPSDKVREMVR